ncbi:SPFH domain-containing protein, partial [Prevotella jejuni]
AESDHKMRFYFFRTAEMVNILWGTASPVKYIEPDYQLPVALGVCGNFSVKIQDASQMFVTLLGTIADYYAEDVQELVSSRIVTPLTAFLAVKAYPYREVDTHIGELSKELQEKTSEELSRLGLELTDFRITSVTFDDETMERIGRIANMTTEKHAAAEVDLDYTGLQKLGALRDAAKNEGGLAGAGLQMGAGLQLAQDIFKSGDVSSDPTLRLRKLQKLLEEQLITAEEYEQKKNEILSKL